MLEHPVITRTERTGYPEEPRRPICPICGEECDTVFKTAWGAVVGCDNCLTSCDAWEEYDLDEIIYDEIFNY